MTIGNFFDTSHTTHIRVRPGWEGTYLIDDISVIASNTIAYAGNDVTVAPGDDARIGVDSGGDGMPCYWYILNATTGLGATPVDSGGQITVHPTDTTTYVVAMDLCGNVTYDTVQVNVNCPGLPVASFSDTGGATKAFTYTGTTVALDSVVWSFGDGSVGTGNAPLHTYTSHDSMYHVCVTVYTRCGNDTACSEIMVSTTGIKNIQKRNVNIWPNPNNGDLNIEGAKNTSLIICDMLGRKVYSVLIIADKQRINIADLSKGVYCAQFFDADNGDTMVKIIKE